MLKKSTVDCHLCVWTNHKESFWGQTIMVIPPVSEDAGSSEKIRLVKRRIVCVVNVPVERSDSE